ncbi:hypothetical protein PEC18_35415 [Paucibacter sp. O1-1]|nr:hypothetical protein [Paucibacter sp. O1-1]MDA3830956.1 hypothetical protein [Paucibacter sp. O1-1]
MLRNREIEQERCDKFNSHAIFVLVGYGLQQQIVFTIGLFALSGAITNWLAIHMLFEKVPGLYGSGVVPSRI